MARDSIRVAVHNGTYHTDDVFALAITVLWAHKKGYDCTMIRTRDESELKNCQVVLDVGGVFDPMTHRYDHHQSSFHEVRSNAVGYASAGLAWRQYGLELCSGDEAAWSAVDNSLIVGIDAIDVGIDLTQSIHESKCLTPDLAYLTSLSRPTWREEIADPEIAMNAAFWRIYEHAKNIINRAIVHARDYVIAENKVREYYNSAEDKRVVVADREYPAWVDVLSNYPEPLFYVYQRSDKSWGAKCVRLEGGKTFKTRVDFPKEWAGLRGAELQSATGVADARFVHLGRYLAIAESQSGVIELVTKVLTI
jgi:uncharacterized UPF0160 family protein